MTAWHNNILRRLPGRLQDKKTAGSAEFKPGSDSDHDLVLSVTEPRKMPRWTQLRFFGRTLTRGERRVFWLSLLVAVLALAGAAATLIAPHLEDIPADGGTVVEALIGTPKLINPIFAGANDVDRDLSSLIFSGLFRLDADLEPQTDLAESWRWLDDKTLEVKIKSGVTFHDGSPLSADDVIFTYQAAKNWHGSLANLFHNLKVIRVDDQTVQFQLDKANPALPAYLTVGILPAQIWDAVPASGATLAEANLKPVGSGPYKVISFQRDAKGTVLNYKLGAYPGYYGQKPHIQQWEFRFFPDREEAKVALRGNQVDALAFLSWGEAAGIANLQLQRLDLELPQETVAFLNVKNSILKDERVRQALTLVMDREELRLVMSDRASLVSSPFPYLAAASSTPLDLNKARSLLQQSGWVLGDGQTIRAFVPVSTTKKKKGALAVVPTPTASSTRLTLTVDVPAQADLLKVADLLKRRWSLLGVKVDIQANDPDVLLQSALDGRDYAVLIWNVLLPPKQDLSAFWSSANTADRGLNLSNLADRDVDKALDAVKAATTTQDVLSARLRLSAAIMERAPALFLLRPTYAYLISNRVHGATDLRLGLPSDRLLQTFNWYVKTKWRWK